MARPVGSTTRPQFHTYVTETDRKAFAKWVKVNYKENKDLAKWYGDQMFGKAVQPLGNDGDKAFIVEFHNAYTPHKTRGDSKESS